MSEIYFPHLGCGVDLPYGQGIEEEVIRTEKSFIGVFLSKDEFEDNPLELEEGNGFVTVHNVENHWYDIDRSGATEYSPYLYLKSEGWDFDFFNGSFYATHDDRKIDYMTMGSDGRYKTILFDTLRDVIEHLEQGIYEYDLYCEDYGYLKKPAIYLCNHSQQDKFDGADKVVVFNEYAQQYKEKREDFLVALIKSRLENTGWRERNGVVIYESLLGEIEGTVNAASLHEAWLSLAPIAHITIQDYKTADINARKDFENVIDGVVNYYSSWCNGEIYRYDAFELNANERSFEQDAVTMFSFTYDDVDKDNHLIAEIAFAMLPNNNFIIGKVERSVGDHLALLGCTAKEILESHSALVYENDYGLFFKVDEPTDDQCAMLKQFFGNEVYCYERNGWYRQESLGEIYQAAYLYKSWIGLHFDSNPIEEPSCSATHSYWNDFAKYMSKKIKELGVGLKSDDLSPIANVDKLSERNEVTFSSI